MQLKKRQFKKKRKSSRKSNLTPELSIHIQKVKVKPSPA
jgi:hypothetical protein